MGEIMFRYFRKHQGPKQETFFREGKETLCFFPYPRRVPSKHVGLKFETLEPRWLLDGTMLQISEFMADNTKTLADGNGKYSDWIEIYNPNANAVNLDGWHLTDNASKPTKWPLPGDNTSRGRIFGGFCLGRKHGELRRSGGLLPHQFQDRQRRRIPRDFTAPTARWHASMRLSSRNRSPIFLTALALRPRRHRWSPPAPAPRFLYRP